MRASGHEKQYIAQLTDTTGTAILSDQDTAELLNVSFAQNYVPLVNKFAIESRIHRAMFATITLLSVLR